MEAWSAISSDNIIHGFKKCCISNNLDGTEGDMLWETVPDNSNSDTSGEETDIEYVYEVF
jgi:hypothetical protein